MYSHKDIEYRTIMVINCIDDRNLRVSNGELLLEDVQEKKTLTKLPFQKIFALFVIGHISITTPLIEKCKQYNVALVVMKLSLRPVFFWSLTAEANYLLRQKQFAYSKDDISIAKVLIYNKINNQKQLLVKTRKKDCLTVHAKQQCDDALQSLSHITDYNSLMGLEGTVARNFFSAYYQDCSWQSRKPRTKIDPINVVLDIGYTILFNFLEAFIRLFGFDVYIGVYHRLWFKRKSLICDIIEPFRCIIDQQVRKSFHLLQFKTKDFELRHGKYFLKRELNSEYNRIFFDALIPHKKAIFLYMQTYYRCFMQSKAFEAYPHFNI